jgi:hypothetical protein
MDATAAAKAAARAVARTGGGFMSDPATFATGAELGLERLPFYTGARGGVLGAVDASVVTAAFVWFEPGAMRQRWEAATAVVPAAELGQVWAACAQRWGQRTLPADESTARMAALAGKIVDGADVAAAPLFAGWRELPRPSTPGALAVHHLNGLRELRGALHAGAVLSAGLRPLEAMVFGQPEMIETFGWTGPRPEVGHLRVRWEAAEEATNVAAAAAYAVLDPGEREEFVDLVTRAATAIYG